MTVRRRASRRNSWECRFCLGGRRTWRTSIKLNSGGNKRKEKIIPIMLVMTLTVIREIIKIYALIVEAHSGAVSVVPVGIIWTLHSCSKLCGASAAFKLSDAELPGMTGEFFLTLRTSRFKTRDFYFTQLLGINFIIYDPKCSSWSVNY